MDLSTIIQTLIDWAVAIGGQVNTLPGGVAFALGLVTWYVVEQVLRRIFNWMRWLILIGVIAGLGFTVPYIFNQFFNLAGPVVLGQETTALPPE